MIRKTLMIGLIALLLSVSLVLSISQDVFKESPFDIITFPSVLTSSFMLPLEKPSPYDRITEEQIHVYKDKIVIDIEEAEWAKFTDTNSMDPVFDYGSNAIEIVPQSEEDIHIGDIASYKSRIAGVIVIHRVVEINEDEQGWYARFKGDNNSELDPEKVRFEQIERIVVGIIY